MFRRINRVMSVYIQIDSIFDIDIQTLAEQVFCIDGHGCANQAMYAGGRRSTDSGGTRSEIKMIRFDDQAAVTDFGTLGLNRRHHCSTSDGYNCYIYGGRGTSPSGSRDSIEKWSFLTRASVTINNNTISSARTGTMGTGTPTSQVYFGGREAGPYPYVRQDAVEFIRNDDTVSATTMETMAKPRWHHCVAGNGLNAIIAGGWDDDADNGIDIPGSTSDTYEKYRMDYVSGDTVSTIERSSVMMPARNDVNSASGGDCVILIGGEEPDYSGVISQIKCVRYDDNVSIMSQALPVGKKEIQCCGNGDVIMAAGGFTFPGGPDGTGGDGESDIYLIKVDDTASIITQSNDLTDSNGFGRSEGSCSSGF
jgi:hypothetical protein